MAELKFAQVSIAKVINLKKT